MNGVFLSGGGARGAYEVGVLKALVQDGPPIQILGGASVGAINAVLAGTGQMDELVDVWHHISTLAIYRPRLDVWNLFRWRSLTDTRPLSERLKKHVHWAKLARSTIQVFIGATNITQRTHEVFSNADITHQHVMASAAIPILFPPVRIGRDWYIDGAFSLLRPLKPLLKAGASRIFTVFLSPRRPRLDAPANLFELADRVLEVLLSSAIASDRNQIESTNQEIFRLRSLGVDAHLFQHKPYRTVEVISIYPSRELGSVSSYVRFSSARARELIELGMSDCYQVLKRKKLL
jgi:NTE family protein